MSIPSSPIGCTKISCHRSLATMQSFKGSVAEELKTFYCPLLLTSRQRPRWDGLLCWHLGSTHQAMELRSQPLLWSQWNQVNAPTITQCVKTNWWHTTSLWSTQVGIYCGIQFSTPFSHLLSPLCLWQRPVKYEVPGLLRCCGMFKQRDLNYLVTGYHTLDNLQLKIIIVLLISKCNQKEDRFLNASLNQAMCVSVHAHVEVRGQRWVSSWDRFLTESKAQRFGCSDWSASL